MDIKKATERYEAWLRTSLPAVIDADLEFKHQQMAAAAFPFLRSTFYRWAKRWTDLCPEFASAPLVLGVGDVHVENYGTWRDTEGRLVWGINDFDEATMLPYPADLVRLATSVALAIREDHLSLRFKDAAGAIVAGYREALTQGGEPFVLAERHSQLRKAVGADRRDPVRFWAKLDQLPLATMAHYPADAVETVLAALPAPPSVTDTSIRSRRAGLASLGRPRLVALATWQGASVAREIKSLLPSAWDWALAHEDQRIHYAAVVGRAIRCADPHTFASGADSRWLVRRLGPDCVRIQLADLPAGRDEAALLHSMGYEVANIHLGTREAVPAILDDLATLAERRPGWLVSAAERMADDTVKDWHAWRG